MKNKVKPFIRRLIKENLIYIMGNVFLFFIILFSLKIGITQILSYNTKISALKNENTQLIDKVNLMNIVVPKSEELEEDVKLLSALIPNTEDYFSIIYALETISKETNFIITNYFVNIEKSTPEKLKIDITGSGDSQSFINFLKNYNFSGGRLITSDRIRLDPSFSESIIVSLTFYNKKTETTGDKIIKTPNKNIYKELSEIKAKVNFSFGSEPAMLPILTDYPKKENPF